MMLRGEMAWDFGWCGWRFGESMNEFTFIYNYAGTDIYFFESPSVLISKTWGRNRSIYLLDALLVSSNATSSYIYGERLFRLYSVLIVDFIWLV